MPTKTKIKTRQAILQEPTPAPIAAPETHEAKVKRILAGMRAKNPSAEIRRDYRDLLDKAPDVALVYGDLAANARQLAADRFEAFPMMQESVKVCSKHMRNDLLGAEPTPLEILLVEAIVLCYLDHFSFQMLVQQKTAQGFNLSDMEQWERVAASKEQRYLRAIGELARVRRLLKLPPLQVNVAIAGGQQVNTVVGELPDSAKGR